MAVNTLEAKAHKLLGQLNPGKLAAVVHLLEVMVHEDDIEDSDTLSPLNRRPSPKPMNGASTTNPFRTRKFWPSLAFPRPPGRR